jgi:ubiquitin-protein ligase E3 A
MKECVRLLPDNDDSSEKPSMSALSGASRLADSSRTSIDVESMRRSFTELYSIPDAPFQSLLVNAIVFLSRTLETDLRSSNLLSRRDEYVNLFLIIMEIPALGSPEFLEAALPQFCKTVGLLSDRIQARLVRIWSTYDVQHLTMMVGSIQQLITVKIVSDYQSPETPKSVHDDDALTGNGISLAF